MLIGAEWRDAASGRQLDVVNPADGTVLAHVPEADEHDVQQAVAAARAFDAGPWRTAKNHRSRTPAARARRLVEANARELAEIESLDNGKPVMVAQRADVAMAAQCFRYMAGWATKIEGSVIDAGMPYMPDSEIFTYTRKEAASAWSARSFRGISRC